MPEKVEQVLERSRQTGLRLAERWSQMPGSAIRGYSGKKKIDFLHGIDADNDIMRGTIAHLYENTLSWLANLDETTRMMHVGSFEKFVFPIIRAVFANLVANELVTVQALSAPTGLIFYLDAIFGTQKGNINRGGRMFDARTGPAADVHYTDEVIEEESLGTGNGTTARFFGNLSFLPVRPGTVLITDGTQSCTDDGNGNLTGADINAGGTNTINYNTGAYDFTFAANVGNAVAITASFEYDMEANEAIPEIDLLLTSAPVTARPFKLRARYSIESEQDFKAYHGISAEVELVKFMANQKLAA